MSEAWMFFASVSELRRYVNKRSVQAIRNYLNQYDRSHSAQMMADAVRRTVQGRAFPTPNAA